MTMVSSVRYIFLAMLIESIVTIYFRHTIRKLYFNFPGRNSPNSIGIVEIEHAVPVRRQHALLPHQHTIDLVSERAREHNPSFMARSDPVAGLLWPPLTRHCFDATLHVTELLSLIVDELLRD